MPQLGRLDLGHWPLTGGGQLDDASLVYATYGTLNEAADNCVLLPTYYTGTHESYAQWIGPGRALDPARYFIVIPNMFGNGVSASPSHRPMGAARAAFPTISIHDNVQAQHRLLEHLGVRAVALAAGWSMGAVQAYHWAAWQPGMIRALLPICGAARCWPLNRVFLEGVRATLLADPAYLSGAYLKQPEAGLRAFGRVYCGWAYSAQFFRDRLYRHLNAESIEEFLLAWEEDHLTWDAGDLLAMSETWRQADIGNVPGYDGDWVLALAGIRARTIVMPCDTDAYFTLAENAIEAALVPDAELRPIVSPYGHCAGAPGRFAAETAAIEAAMRELLDE